MKEEGRIKKTGEDDDKKEDRTELNHGKKLIARG